jgi:hypothetical protein
MASKKVLKAEIANIERQLKSANLDKKKRKHLGRTLTRKRKQLTAIKQVAIQFSQAMKVREISENNKNTFNYYSTLRGEKPRYKTSVTRTRKVYTSENPYPEYLEKRERTGRRAASQAHRQKVQRELESIPNSPPKNWDPNWEKVPSA